MQNNQSASGLQYDDLGFIIGMKRMGRDIDKIDINVEAIRKILEQAATEFKAIAGQSERQQPSLSAYQRALLDATQRTAVDFEEHLQRTITPVNQSLVDMGNATEELINLVDQVASQQTSPKQANNRSTANNSGNRPGRSRITPNSDTVDIGSTESLRRNFSRQNADNAPGDDATSDRSRDSRGRFTGDGSGDGQKSFFAKVAKGFVGAIKGLMPDSKGVDPTVDAINELGTLLSPVRKVAGFALRPLSGLFKSRKRNEPIPREQEQHNRRQIKLLQRIADNLKGTRAGKLLGGAGGLLGGLFGGAGKGLGKLLKGGGKGLLKLLKFGRGIPLVGTALAAGASLFDWKNQTTEQKGGSVGSLAGGAAGAALGSLLGPVGTIAGGMLGSWAGEKLGTVVAPYVKNWTDDLTKADIPGRIVSAWKTFTDGLGTYFKEAWDNIVEKGKEIASDTKDTVFSIADWSASLLDKGLAGMGSKDAQERVNQRERGEIGYQRKGYQAKTTQNAPTLWQTMQDSANSLMMQPATGKYAPLLDEIARGESRKGAFGTSGYDAVYSGATVKPSKPISQMTVGEVKAYQRQLMKAGSTSTAVGRYQFIHNKGAFAKMAAEAGLKDSDIFNNAAQDRLAIHYMGGAQQIDKWIKTGNHKALTNKVAEQWASQKNSRGFGNYDGDGLNTARHGGVAVIRDLSEKIATNQATVPQTKATEIKPAQIPKATKPIITKDSPVYVWRKPVEAKATRSTTTTNLATQQASAAPKVESVKERLSSPAPKEVVVVNQNNDTISQNVSNRGLAHAFTGGLGMGKHD
ncbi:lysozyme family protein [Alkanindiges illinoisensis]|uniref:hypothetical protein n=1 Tax=Alkanindiges illinoisensis TaxID=197183 RepID=UPI000479B693|nr:hypothetical protein [Alkanindiges illinoisensis]